MKKLLFLTLSFCVFAMSAQNNEGKFAIEKGTWNISGNLSIEASNSTTERSENTTNFESSNSGFSFTPSVSYFLSNNLSIGLAVGYGYFENENTNGINQNLQFRNQYSIAPTIKKLFPVGKNFAFSLQGELGYMHSKSNTSDGAYRLSQNTYSMTLRPGIDFFVTKKLALQANIGALQYRSMNSKSDNSINPSAYSKGNSQTFNFNLNSANILFGLSYYL